MAIQTTDLVQISNHWDEVPARPEPHAATLLGTPILPVQKGLPKVAESLCPECTQVVMARIFEEEGRVMMEKHCSEHGYFKDVVWSDVRLYLKAEAWTFADGQGVANPAVPDAVSCPTDCGICKMHVSHTGLANVDLTNRCDLTCPVCFANANAAGFVYEPTLEQIRRMLRQLREMQPVAGRIIQFSGGEPTLHPQFPEALKTAKELGFSHIQVATNGIRFGSEPGFAERCAEAGLHTLYLQFDGLSDDIYRKTRGRDLWAVKQAAVEAVRRAGMKIVFVPTVVRGINDHAVGAILKYALENIDVASGITYQPVAFTGRIAQRCVVHYSAPDGKIYPFCSYNSGPVFRERIEKQFSQTFDEYRALHSDAVGIPRAGGSNGRSS
jgi:7,8-dihydro-6-hydroxymethylpterin dimethyltransferase